jgi:hypothetical protein
VKIFLKHQNRDYSVNIMVRNMCNTSKERYLHVQSDKCMVSPLNEIFGTQNFTFLPQSWRKNAFYLLAFCPESLFMHKTTLQLLQMIGDAKSFILICYL